MILTVIGLIAFAAVLMTPADDGQRVKGRKMTVEDLVSKEIKPRQFNGTWISGKSFKRHLSCLV